MWSEASPRSSILFVVLLEACGSPATSRISAQKTAQANPVVTSLRLDPRTATLAAGAELQFQVAVKWTNGATFVPALTWTAEAGQVVGRGLYTAAPKPGTYRVIAMLESGALADTVLVTVTPGSAPAPAPTPAPAPAPAVPRTQASKGPAVVSPGPPTKSPWATHEPADFTPIVGRKFLSLGNERIGRGDGSFPWKIGGSEGFDDVEGRYRNIFLFQDPTAPLSPPGVVRMRYPAGPVGNGSLSPGVVQSQSFTNPVHGKLHYRKIYFRAAFKVSANWQGHPTGTNKLLFIRANGNTRCEPIVRLRGVGSGTLVLNVDLQGSPRDRRNRDNSSLNPNRGSGVVERGAWHLVEGELEMGTNGSSNGRLRIWFDGNLTHEYSDIEYEPAANGTWYWDALHVAPVWGGGGGVVNQDMYLDYDEFYVSGAP